MKKMSNNTKNTSQATDNDTINNKFATKPQASVSGKKSFSSQPESPPTKVVEGNKKGCLTCFIKLDNLRDQVQELFRRLR